MPWTTLGCSPSDSSSVAAVCRSAWKVTGESRTLKEGAVHVGEEVAGLHGPSERIGEHQPQVEPKFADPLALLFLACSMAPKGATEDGDSTTLRRDAAVWRFVEATLHGGGSTS